MDDFEVFELQQKELNQDAGKKKSSFERATPELVDKKFTDFLVLPKAINDKKRLAGLHSFRIANSKLYRASTQYLLDIYDDKFYKLEKASTLSSCFINNDLHSLTNHLVCSETHACLVFAEILLLEAEMIKSIPIASQDKGTFPFIFEGNSILILIKFRSCRQESKEENSKRDTAVIY